MIVVTRGRRVLGFALLPDTGAIGRPNAADRDQCHGQVSPAGPAYCKLSSREQQWREVMKGRLVLSAAPSRDPLRLQAAC